ncbi:aldehyde dehydrogenase family protein [Pseudomonas baetica]|jgi:aldehyde dehydrogenase (NAD+)|uniref:aldehyde dehydrogenase family protein n=1 Tax=Pseudomonas baetica TaxID=674054 RepID=UPI001C8B1293|nr:aldehyde dehydrogenase family protein [Pseudomonas baetica]MBX9404392.1 aldehyde dehydrogenase family protein [Pseudomonas baetica]
MSDRPPLWQGFTGQYIAGAWRSGSTRKVLENRNPYNNELLTEISLGDAQDLDAAYQAAAIAQKAWALTLPGERSALFMRAVNVLDARHEEIVDWLIRESGSTRTKAEIEWAAVRSTMITAAAMPSRVVGRILPIDTPDKESRVYRKPLGVVGVISPWNWPLHLSNRSIAPALALGNAVVVKPADDTPVTGGLLLAKIYEEAGFPPGILNIVVGDVADLGDAFTLHPIPKFISFTGSTRVGRHIGALAVTGPTLKRVGLELGGNAPCVVLDDADLDLAVHAAVVGRFLHQGQICMSSNRIIVDASLQKDFVEAFVERVRQLKVGDPNLADTVIGPLINRRQLEGAVARIEAAKAEGIELLLGGAAQGQVLPPHVFVNVDNMSDLAQAEQFCPVAPIITARDEAHALELANQTEFGLSSAVFTKDEGRGLRFAQQIEAGMTHINDISVNDDPNNMFGGEKNSGIGRFNSEWIIAELTSDHWISVQHKRRAYPF